MRKIIGLVENVKVLGRNGGKIVKARVDTGATKSSIDEELADELGLGPAVKTTRIRSATGREKRRVIRATVVVSDEFLSGFFSVTKREIMNYKLLIGRNILRKGKFLIDPLRKGYIIKAFK